MANDGPHQQLSVIHLHRQDQMARLQIRGLWPDGQGHGCGQGR